MPAQATGNPQDSVSINTPELSCGEQTTTFTGLATYSSNSQHLLVELTLNGNILHSHSEPTNWETTEVVLAPGTYTLTATIKDFNVGETHYVTKATDSVEFTVEECVEEERDVCENLEGNQETLPEGYQYDENKNCVEIPQVDPPVVTKITKGEVTELPQTGGGMGFVLAGLAVTELGLVSSLIVNRLRRRIEG